MTSDTRVERCRLAFVCGQRWEELEALAGTDLVRFCLRCQASVHLATTPEEFGGLAAQGRCVAVSAPETGMMVGRTTAETAPYRVFRVEQGTGGSKPGEDVANYDDVLDVDPPEEKQR